jgi:hypothetical protein
MNLTVWHLPKLRKSASLPGDEYYERLKVEFRDATRCFFCKTHVLNKGESDGRAVQHSGNDSAGVVWAERKYGPQRNAVSNQSSDSNDRVAGCCEHRKEHSDLLKGGERFHLATLKLSSNYSFTLKSRKQIQWNKPHTPLPTTALFPPSAYLAAV